MKRRRRWQGKRHRHKKNSSHYIQINHAEAAIARVLKQFLKQDLIKRYLWARKNGELDADGVDFLIYLKKEIYSGLSLSLQVKFNTNGDDNYLVQEHLSKHSHIPFVIILRTNDLPRKNQEQLYQKLFDLIKDYLV